MTSVVYPAIVERTRDGFSAFFPDLPGCVSAGRSLNELALNAEEALSGHLLVAAQHKDEVAGPGDLADFDDADIDVFARILVRAELPGRSVRVNITLDEGLVAAIDKVADNRSGFLAEAARDALARRRELIDA